MSDNYTGLQKTVVDILTDLLTQYKDQVSNSELSDVLHVLQSLPPSGLLTGPILSSLISLINERDCYVPIMKFTDRLMFALRCNEINAEKLIATIAESITDDVDPNTSGKNEVSKFDITADQIRSQQNNDVEQVAGILSKNRWMLALALISLTNAHMRALENIPGVK